MGVGLALGVRWSAVNISKAMFARASSERTKRGDLPSTEIEVGTIEWRERGGKWAGGSGSRLLRAHPPPSAPMFAASAAGASRPPRQCLPRQRRATSAGAMGGGKEKRGGGGSGGKEKNRAADDGPPALAGEHAGREKATDTDDAHRIRRGSDTHPGQKAIAA